MLNLKVDILNNGRLVHNDLVNFENSYIYKCGHA